jgi:hypothetical protein
VEESGWGRFEKIGKLVRKMISYGDCLVLINLVLEMKNWYAVFALEMKKWYPMYEGKVLGVYKE